MARAARAHYDGAIVKLLLEVSVALLVAAALLLPLSGLAANSAAAESLSAGKSFLEHASTNEVEEPPDSLPANFPGPLVPQPRRKPEPGAMLLACLGLFVYLGRRRAKALAV